MVQVGAVGKVSMLVAIPDPPVITSPAIGKLYEIHIYEIHILIQLITIYEQPLFSPARRYW